MAGLTGSSVRAWTSLTSRPFSRAFPEGVFHPIFPVTRDLPNGSLSIRKRDHRFPREAGGEKPRRTAPSPPGRAPIREGSFYSMHIAEGVLSAPILFAGGAACAAGLAVGLKRLPTDRLATVAIFSATFFIASLIHVPVGPSSVHLLLNGLIGLILGWAAFPAIFIGLLLQAILFQFGGLTVLGCNTVNMALPAVLFGMAARPFLTKGKAIQLTAGFLCGVLSVFGAALLTALCMFFTDEGFLTAAKLLFISEIPISVVEGLVTMLTAAFLMKVDPGLLLGRSGK